MSYNNNKERTLVHCSACETDPHLEIRPGIGVIATCECNGCQKMEFSGRMPGDWE